MNEEISRLQQQAEQGDANAQYQLGFIYYEGKDLPQSFEKAFEWFQKAADKGHTNAQCKIGFMYCIGEGVAESFEKSAEWFQKAAEQGNAQAQFMLSLMYAKGRGVPQNNEKALKWGYKAAQGGHRPAVTLFQGVDKLFPNVAEDGSASCQSEKGQAILRFMRGLWHDEDRSEKTSETNKHSAPSESPPSTSKPSPKAIRPYPASPPSTPTPVTTNAPSKSAEPGGFGWFIKCLKHYADFSGRARRKEYWMFTLFYLIFLVAGMLLSALLFKNSATLGFVYSLAFLLPSLAVGVRRLHDSGRSGWWMLISLIPYVGVICLLVLMCLDSQSGTNKYGSYPKGVGAPTPSSPPPMPSQPLPSSQPSQKTLLSCINKAEMEMRTLLFDDLSPDGRQASIALDSIVDVLGHLLIMIRSNEETRSFGSMSPVDIFRRHRNKILSDVEARSLNSFTEYVYRHRHRLPQNGQDTVGILWKLHEPSAH